MKSEGQKRGLQLERVVLLGRTLEEYARFFAFDPAALQGLRVLDLAGGVSSFCAEASALGLDAVASDPIYELTAAEIAARCEPDLNSVYQAIGNLPTYRWTAYRSPEHMREYRERAWKTFLPHYAEHRGAKYVAGALPNVPFADASFDLTLVSYFLFVYEHQFSYEFHREAILEVMRVTKGEARVYPLVTFEAERSGHLERLLLDPAVGHLRFEEVRTDFEFLVNSNAYLRITHV